MAFHDGFKRIANERGTNPTKVVLALGLSSSKVALWNGGSIPKEDVLERLAAHLHCHVYEFFMDENDLYERRKVEERADTNIVLDPDVQEFARIYAKLSRKEQHHLMAQLYDIEERAEQTRDTAENA